MSVEFDVGCPPLRHGENEIEVRLIRRGADPAETPVLEGVDVTVGYGGQ